MLAPDWRDPRLFPLVAAPVMGLLGVLEASADAEFRQSFAELALVAAWLTVGFLVQARLPAVGGVLVACFYPLQRCSGHPAPAARA